MCCVVCAALNIDIAEFKKGKNIFVFEQEPQQISEFSRMLTKVSLYMIFETDVLTYDSIE